MIQSKERPGEKEDAGGHPRPAAIALLVLLLFVGAIEAARAWGVWNNGITNQKYEQHLRDRGNPQYSHVG